MFLLHRLAGVVLPLCLAPCETTTLALSVFRKAGRPCVGSTTDAESI